MTESLLEPFRSHFNEMKTVQVAKDKIYTSSPGLVTALMAQCNDS